VHRDDDALDGPFNNDLGNTTFGDTCIQVFPDLFVFDQLFGKIFPSVPVGFPSPDDT
jgi:hypothetical protein